MPSIFSKIVAGDIPCYKVAENENFLAFLDISPLAKGHTLVIPKKETDYIFDMESEEYKELWAFAQKVAKAQKKIISPHCPSRGNGRVHVGGRGGAETSMKTLRISQALF